MILCNKKKALMNNFMVLLKRGFMITIQDLTKKYKCVTIFNKVSLTIPDNKITFIMGKNGSGKTTFIKCLLHLESYDGDIRFDNKNLSEVRDKIFVIFDDCPFYTQLSGNGNIELLCNCKKNEYKSIATKYMDDSLLKKQVKNYSYGQKKKLALIAAEIRKPKYLIMDEISNGLDYESIIELQDHLLEISKTSTVILTGHQFEFYEKIVNNLIYIHDYNLINIEDYDKNGMALKDVYYQYVK